ncbi:hypothetical protein V6N12_046828 [Hibiscus sabdariffa]|uniref:Uncharacterized protein n=1 Tax=Hibiscus sabdariffa TaxID=183260 RepID=A0ABR2AKJ1_9ROSI
MQRFWRILYRIHNPFSYAADGGRMQWRRTLHRPVLLANDLHCPPPSLFSDRRENQGLIAQRNRKSSISSNVFPPLTRSDSVVERPLEYSSDEGYGDDDDNNDNDDDDDEDE